MFPESNLLLDILRASLSDLRETREYYHEGGGSNFRVIGAGQALVLSKADRNGAVERPPVVVTITNGYSGVNFTLTNDEAISLMAFLSEVTE